jgi:RimJ/RimL family protein N-acetyltransferase
VIAEVILTGQRVRLRPLRDQDVPLLHHWFWHPDVEPWLLISEDPPELRTLEAARERYERVRSNPLALAWCIETQAGIPIGSIELDPISQLHRRAELSLLIGGENARGQGYGTDAILTLLRYAIVDLNLRRVGLVVDADNVRALRCYEKCGFRREGLLRSFRLRYGQPVDMVVMGVLREEMGM